jgi:peptidoglycan hydrolase-like protein with peptidoglycan-binding domain
MTPFWARLVFLGFMALASAISFNALHMQGKRPPVQAMAAARKEPPAQEKPAEKPAENKPARDAPGAEQSQPSANQAPVPTTPATAALGTQGPATPPAETQPAPEAPSPKIMQAIQRELKLHGYRPGNGPGVDSTTRAAIISFEFDQGMQLTGEATETLLKSILFAPAKGRQARTANDKFEKNQELVREIQAILAQLGFSAVTADGTMSDGTRDAIRRFEASRKMPESGKLGERLLLEIIQVSGRRIGVAS